MAKRNATGAQLRKGNIILTVILVFLLIGVGFLVYYLFFKPVPFPQSAVSLQTQTNNTEVFATPDGLIVVDGKILTRKNGDFKDMWSIELPEENCSAAASDSLTAVWTDERVIVFNSAGTLLQHMSPPGPVEAMACGTDSFAMLCREEGQRNIYIYKAVSGNLTQKIQFPDQTVNAMGFFGDKSAYLWAAVTDVYLNEVTSHMKVFVPGQSLLVTITISNDVMLHCYSRNNDLYIVGTDNIYLYDIAGNLKQQTGIYGWEMLDASVSEKGLSLLAAPAGLVGNGPLGRLRYIGMDGAVVTDNTFDIESDARWALLQDGGVITAGLSSYQVLTTAGRVKKTLQSPQPIEKLYGLPGVQALAARHDDGTFSFMKPSA